MKRKQQEQKARKVSEAASQTLTLQEPPGLRGTRQHHAPGACCWWRGWCCGAQGPATRWCACRGGYGAGRWRAPGGGGGWVGGCGWFGWVV